MNSNQLVGPSRIPRLPELAKMPSVRRLRDALKARGHHEHSASAIALAVCDPAAARRQLDEPGRLRVVGGHLEVIQTDVWTPALIPYPVNPRASTSFVFPVEAKAERRAPLPDLVPSDDPSACELVIPEMATSRLIGALDAQTELLRSTNDLSESVGLLGVREPLLLLPLVVANPEATHNEQTAVLSTVDGSSRLTAALKHLDLTPADVLLHLARDERRLRQKIGAVLALRERPQGALADEEFSELRALASPATIIVGFVADEPTATLAEAISSRLGALHVDPPRPWSDSSRLDVQLDVALNALEIAGQIDADENAWLGGRMSPDDATRAGLQASPDVRASCLKQFLTRPDSSVSKALRNLTSKSRITPRMRAELAAEGAIRSFRSELTEAQMSSARALLTAVYQMDEVKSPHPLSPRIKGPEDRASGTVRDAIDELRTYGGPGPLVRQLLLLASYWLAKHRVVGRQTRGGQSDRRDITTVLSLMMSTEQGVRQLIAIIEDGRKGLHPRQVDAAGRVVLSEAGEPLLLDGPWIRKTWALGAENDEIEEADAPPLSPEATLEQRQSALRLSLRGVSEALAKLNDAVDSSGLPLVEDLGLPPKITSTLLEELSSIQEQLLLFRAINARRQRLLSTSEFD